MSNWTQEIPTVTIAQEEVASGLSCSVCFEDFRLGEAVRKLVCSHLFHDPCILPWAEHHSTCPVCRTKLSEDAFSDKGDVIQIDDLSSVEYESVFDDVTMDEVSSDDDMEVPYWYNNFPVQYSFFRRMESLLEPATELQSIFPSFIRDRSEVIQSSLNKLEEVVCEPLTRIPESLYGLTEDTSNISEFQSSYEPIYEIQESFYRRREYPTESLGGLPEPLFEFVDAPIKPLPELKQPLHDLSEDIPRPYAPCQGTLYAGEEDPLAECWSKLPGLPSYSEESLYRLSEDGVPDDSYLFPHSSHAPESFSFCSMDFNISASISAISLPSYLDITQ